MSLRANVTKPVYQCLPRQRSASTNVRLTQNATGKFQININKSAKADHNQNTLSAFFYLTYLIK